MKKTIILAVVAFAISTGTVLAAPVVLQWQESKRLADGFTQRIYSKVLDREGLGVVKFQDENTVCYIAFQEYTNGSYNPSMQCNFK